MSINGKRVIIHFIAIDAADAEWPWLLDSEDCPSRVRLSGVRMTFRGTGSELHHHQSFAYSTSRSLGLGSSSRCMGGGGIGPW